MSLPFASAVSLALRRLRPLCLRLRAWLFDAPARLRRGLSNRLLPHLLLLLRARTHLLLSLRGLLCARVQSLLTLGLSLRLLLLPQGHPLPLCALTLGHARGPLVRRLRRARLRR